MLIFGKFQICQDFHLQDVHEIFKYPLPLRLQSHVFKGGFFQEPISDLRCWNESELAPQQDSEGNTGRKELQDRSFKKQNMTLIMETQTQQIKEYLQWQQKNILKNTDVLPPMRPLVPVGAWPVSACS